jgi:hypothetical protein
MRMKRIAQVLIGAVVLSAVCEDSSALIVLEGISKQDGEKNLGLVMRRECIGTVGSVTNLAAISIEFWLKGELEEFLEVQLNVYSELPTGSRGPYRLLASTTLRRAQTAGKVSLFFVVDEDYLNRTEVTILVRNPAWRKSNGYSIRLSRKDFPPPNARASNVALDTQH